MGSREFDNAYRGDLCSSDDGSPGCAAASRGSTGHADISRRGQSGNRDRPAHRADRDLGFIAFGVSMVLFGTVRANGQVIWPLIILFVSMYPVRLGVAIGLREQFGSDALWLSFPAAMVSTLLMATVLYFHGGWKRTHRCISTPTNFKGSGLCIAIDRSRPIEQCACSQCSACGGSRARDVKFLFNRWTAYSSRSVKATQTIGWLGYCFTSFTCKGTGRDTIPVCTTKGILHAPTKTYARG